MSPAPSPSPAPSAPSLIELDARGLLCPLPVLKARKILADMHRGQRLAIVADDPAAPLDFADFCDTGGHTLLEQSPLAGDAIRFVISKGDKNSSE